MRSAPRRLPSVQHDGRHARRPSAAGAEGTPVSLSLENRLADLAAALRRILDDLEMVEVRARERGEDRTWPVIAGILERLRTQAGEANNLADEGPFLDDEDDP